MNAGTSNDNPPEYTVPPWLLLCICSFQRCHCNARFKPDIICIKGLPYQANPLNIPRNNLKIQFTEFAYCNDRFFPETIIQKIEKYQPLVDNITNRGWNVEPLIVITACAKATTYIPSMKILKEKLKILEKTIRQTFNEINTIAIQHAMSIVLHKRRLENNEPLSIDRNQT